MPSSLGNLFHLAHEFFALDFIWLSKTVLFGLHRPAQHLNMSSRCLIEGVADELGRMFGDYLNKQPW